MKTYMKKIIYRAIQFVLSSVTVSMFCIGITYSQTTFDTMLFLNQMNQSNCTGKGGHWTGMDCAGGSSTTLRKKFTPAVEAELRKLADKYWSDMAHAAECLVVFNKPDTLEGTREFIKNTFNQRKRDDRTFTIYRDKYENTYVVSIGMGTPGYDGWPSLNGLKRRRMLPPDGYCVPRQEAKRMFIPVEYWQKSQVSK